MTARNQIRGVRFKRDRDWSKVNESCESSNQRSMPRGFVFAVRRVLGPPVTIERCFEGLTLKVDPKLFSALLDDQRLSLGSFKLWHVLYRMTGKNKCCWPSIRTLARLLGNSPQSVTDWLNELKEFGYIKVVRGNRRSSNQYIVNPCVPKYGTPVPIAGTPVPENVGSLVLKTGTQCISVNRTKEENTQPSVAELIKQLKDAAS